MIDSKGKKKPKKKKEKKPQNQKKKKKQQTKKKKKNKKKKTIKKKRGIISICVREQTHRALHSGGGVEDQSSGKEKIAQEVSRRKKPCFKSTPPPEIIGEEVAHPSTGRSLNGPHHERLGGRRHLVDTMKPRLRSCPGRGKRKARGGSCRGRAPKNTKECRTQRGGALIGRGGCETSSEKHQDELGGILTRSFEGKGALEKNEGEPARVEFRSRNIAVEKGGRRKKMPGRKREKLSATRCSRAADIKSLWSFGRGAGEPEHSQVLRALPGKGGASGMFP